MTTHKPPPPSFRPTAGFPSVTEAVRHFTKEGKSPKEIAVLVESTTEAVRGLMQKARRERRSRATDGLTWPQRAKVKRVQRKHGHLPDMRKPRPKIASPGFSKQSRPMAKSDRKIPSRPMRVK